MFAKILDLAFRVTVANIHSPTDSESAEWSGLNVQGRIKLGSEGVPGEEGSLTFR